MVPMHALKDKVTLEKFKILIDMTINANFNILRIWGGGYFLPNEF